MCLWRRRGRDCEVLGYGEWGTCRRREETRVESAREELFGSADASEREENGYLGSGWVRQDLGRLDPDWGRLGPVGEGEEEKVRRAKTRFEFVSYIVVVKETIHDLLLHLLAHARSLNRRLCELGQGEQTQELGIFQSQSELWSGIEPHAQLRV